MQEHDAHVLLYPRRDGDLVLAETYQTAAGYGSEGNRARVWSSIGNFGAGVVCIVLVLRAVGKTQASCFLWKLKERHTLSLPPQVVASGEIQSTPHSNFLLESSCPLYHNTTT